MPVFKPENDMGIKDRILSKTTEFKKTPIKQGRSI